MSFSFSNSENLRQGTSLSSRNITEVFFKIRFGGTVVCTAMVGCATFLFFGLLRSLRRNIVMVLLGEDLGVVLA